MKKVFKYIGVLSILALSACDVAPKGPESIRSKSPLDTNKVQLFIFADTKDVAISPADSGKFKISSAEGTVVRAEKKFPIVFGRHIDSEEQKAPAEVAFKITDKSAAFTLRDTARFAQGQAVDTVWVSTDLDFGESAKLLVEIPEAYRSTYGGGYSKEIKVAVDYTWLDHGTGVFTTSFWNESGDVAIQYAKEYKGEGEHATDTLFRLVSPYFVTDSAEETAPGVKTGSSYTVKEGYHIQILTDKDYNIITCGPAEEEKAYIYDIGLNYDGTLSILLCGKKSVYYTTYEYVHYARTNNIFTIDAVIAQDGTLSWFETITFEWKSGCPASLQVDPTEGEGELNITPDKAELVINTKATVISPINETLAEYRVPGSYKLSLTSLLNLTSDRDTVSLIALVPYDDEKGIVESGTYTVRSQDATAPNSILAGAFDGTQPSGSYVKTGNALYYIVSGTVTVKNDTDADEAEVVIDALTSKGTKIKLSYKGAAIEPTII